MIRPTRAAILLAAAGIAVALLPVFVSPGLWRVWVAFVGSAGLLAGADALLAASPRSLRISATAPRLLYIGDDPGELCIEVGAPDSWRRASALCDLDPLFMPQPEQKVSPAVPLRVPLVALRRGEARLRALWVRWRGPLGLVQRELRHPLDLTVAIAPNVRAVRRTALRFFGARQFLSGIKVERYTGDGSEFEALREYQAGLDHRAMNWKASARHRKLLSQEFRAERNHQVVVAIDTGHLMREPLVGIPRLDHAINGGLLLSYFCLRTGDRVGLFGFDEKVRCFAGDYPAKHSRPDHMLNYMILMRCRFGFVPHKKSKFRISIFAYFVLCTSSLVLSAWYLKLRTSSVDSGAVFITHHSSFYRLFSSYDRRFRARMKARNAATTHPTPPVTTESGAPMSEATAPASTSPSCGPPMKKIILMEVIRPRK